MGVDVGFKLYYFNNNKLEEVNLFNNYGYNCNYLNIRGRCDATYRFVDLVDSFRKKNAYFDDAKPEDKYSCYLLLNHPELDGLEDHSNSKELGGWFAKYFYFSLEKFKSSFDFIEAQEKHDDLLKELNEKLIDMQKEVESLRIHQENAKTKIAFDGFEAKIKELKEMIAFQKEYIKDKEEDDYDYNHYMWIKKDIERVEEIIKNDPDIVVVAYASY